jgi:hypothetical protein
LLWIYIHVNFTFDFILITAFTASKFVAFIRIIVDPERSNVGVVGTAG